MKTYTFKIEQDIDGGSPREEYDNVGVMLCKHSRYNLGDENAFDKLMEIVDKFYEDADHDTLDPDDREFLENCEYEDEDIRGYVNAFIRNDLGIALPLYLYDHGGITMRTSPFSCPWDSGQVGFIFADWDTIAHEWGIDDDDTEVSAKERATNYLMGEVETYDMYLTGQVYGYVITETLESGHSKETDSLWGMYGYDYCEEEAKDMIKWLQDEVEEEEIEAAVEEEATAEVA